MWLRYFRLIQTKVNCFDNKLVYQPTILFRLDASPEQSLNALFKELTACVLRVGRLLHVSWNIVPYHLDCCSTSSGTWLHLSENNLFSVKHACKRIWKMSKAINKWEGVWVIKTMNRQGDDYEIKGWKLGKLRKKRREGDAKCAG